MLENSPIAPVHASRNLWRDRDLWTVLAATVVTRLSFALATHKLLRSVDVLFWRSIVAELHQGHNPYVSTNGMLNWPPLWMQILYVLDSIATATHLPFTFVLQGFLVATELLVIVVAYRLLVRTVPSQSPGPILFWGIALNPICLLLTVQHCNFDVIVGLFCLIAVSCLSCYVQTRDPMEWLAACLWVGLAILAKTVPLVLLPVLLLRTRGLGAKTLAFGAALALGPVALGMSIIYVLSPEAVTRHVLMYRSAIGTFGLTGLPAWIGLTGFPLAYAHWFPPALLLILTAVAYAARRAHGASERHVVLLPALLLLAVPALGPGYAPQYLYWSLPLLVVSYCMLTPSARRWMKGCAVVAAASYILEYSFVPALGELVSTVFHENQSLRAISGTLYASRNVPLLRLPLFVVMLITLWLLLRAICRRSTPAPTPEPAQAEALRAR